MLLPINRYRYCSIFYVPVLVLYHICQYCSTSLFSLDITVLFIESHWQNRKVFYFLGLTHVSSRVNQPAKSKRGFGQSYFPFTRFFHIFFAQLIEFFGHQIAMVFESSGHGSDPHLSQLLISSSSHLEGTIDVLA